MDKKSFEKIIEDYHVNVYRLAYKFTYNKDDAEDITQNTFMRAYEFLLKNKNDNEINFKPWLMTICVNLCRNLAKKKKSFNFSDLETEDDPDIVERVRDKEKNPAEVVLEVEQKKHVNEAIELLPKKYQVVIQMRYKDELDYKEIADTLDLPLNTIKAHISRAKKMLENHLKGYAK